MRLFVAALALAAPAFAQCTYTMDKTSISLPAAATASSTVNVTATPATCRWLPNITAGSWLHLSTASQTAVTGSGSFTFSADANPIGQTRSGHITILTE